MGLERGKDFLLKVPSQNFPEILASQATGSHSPKWDEGLEVKGQQQTLKLFLPGAGSLPQLQSFPACSPMCVF